MIIVSFSKCKLNLAADSWDLSAIYQADKYLESFGAVVG